MQCTCVIKVSGINYQRKLNSKLSKIQSCGLECCLETHISKPKHSSIQTRRQQLLITYQAIGTMSPHGHHFLDSVFDNLIWWLIFNTAASFCTQKNVSIMSRKTYHSVRKSHITSLSVFHPADAPEGCGGQPADIEFAESG